MEAYLVEFGNLLLRWLHVIAAIAWIGESIYFVMLDNSLKTPTDDAVKKRGVLGERPALVILEVLHHLAVGFCPFRHYVYVEPGFLFGQSIQPMGMGARTIRVAS